jgi:hypothetical protein
VVPGIAAGTAYRLTAQVKVSDPSETVFIGIFAGFLALAFLEGKPVEIGAPAFTAH